MGLAETSDKSMAEIERDLTILVGPGVVVDLSDATGDYQIYTPQMIEERVDVRESARTCHQRCESGTSSRGP